MGKDCGEGLIYVVKNGVSVAVAIARDVEYVENGQGFVEITEMLEVVGEKQRYL